MKVQKRIILEDADVINILELYSKKRLTDHGTVNCVDKDEFGNFVVLFADQNIEEETNE